MKEKRLLHNYAHGNEAFHASECLISSDNTKAHYHDFAELFWVIAGEGVHHVGHTSQRVSPGDLVLLRPQDYHFFEPTVHLRFFNLAFPAGVLDSLHERYFSNVDNFYGLSEEVPVHLINPRIDSSWLNYQKEILLGENRDLIILDLFLMNLFQRIYFHGALMEAEPEPEWLRTLMSMLNKQEFLSLPISEIARKLGITPEYFARGLKKYRKIKPSHLLIRSRMDYAAGELQYTDRPIISISMDCGYTSLSHFYRVFHKYWSLSPLEFRRSRKMEQQKIVV